MRLELAKSVDYAGLTLERGPQVPKETLRQLDTQKFARGIFFCLNDLAIPRGFQIVETMDSANDHLVAYCMGQARLDRESQPTIPRICFVKGVTRHEILGSQGTRRGLQHP